MKKDSIRWIALLAVTVIALYLCWRMLQPIVEVLLWAVVLVIVFHPIHRRIVARTGSPGWSAVISCLLVMLTILLPLSLVTFAVVKQLTGVAQYVQTNSATLLDPNSPVIGRIYGWLAQYVPDLGQTNPSQFLAERLKNLSGAIAGRTIGFVGGAVGVIVEVFFVIFTMYYLFRDGGSLSRGLREALPLEKTQAQEILERTREVISASVYGVLVIAFIQGMLGGLAFWVLGLPSPLLWGVVMLLLSMIPMAGSFIVWVPAAVFLGVSGEWGKAIALTLWGALVIGTVDNFLRPKLVGDKTKLHELIIFFSVIGGLQVFGVIGLVLGPVIVAITLALLDVFHRADQSFSPATAPDDSLFDAQAEVRNVPAKER